MGHHHDRPSPEELLDRYQLREMHPTSEAATETDDEDDVSEPHHRGRLRIYLGMAAGVGKTYTMLNEGRRRMARGTDVVIGLVETHGRPLTEQQIGDLPIVPRKRIEYRGAVLEEMDIDAILARHPRPKVVLVDELAHTNAPGSRHAKRYQDVLELLDAGITVVATLNIQHLEGLNDLVQDITGIRQRETLPDRVLDEADEVELIDIAPDALRSRMRHGNVYPPDRAQLALERYFTSENLTALRELALRRVAEKTEAQLEHMMLGQDALQLRPAIPADRVMICFLAHPSATQLLRAGVRLARGLKAPVLAITVINGNPSIREMKVLETVQRLAVDLAAEVHVISGQDVAESLAEMARENHITHIVIGQPSRSRWQELLRQSVVNRLLRLPTGAAIHVVPTRRDEDDEAVAR